MLPSASTQQWERGEGERCRVFLHSTGGEGGGTSLVLYENQQDPRARVSHDHAEGGWSPLGTDPAEREGLCQLSDDVMIYFEEVMSGLCSEAGGVYSGSLDGRDISSATSSCCATCLCEEGGVHLPKNILHMIFSV